MENSQQLPFTVLQQVSLNAKVEARPACKLSFVLSVSIWFYLYPFTFCKYWLDSLLYISNWINKVSLNRSYSIESRRWITNTNRHYILDLIYFRSAWGSLHRGSWLDLNGISICGHESYESNVSSSWRLADGWFNSRLRTPSRVIAVIDLFWFPFLQISHILKLPTPQYLRMPQIIHEKY